MAQERRGVLLLRFTRRLPAPILNGVPSLAWALLVRLPESWASRLLKRIIPAVYEAVQHEGAAADDRFMRAEVDQFQDAWQGIVQEITSVSVQIPQSTILVSVRFRTRGRGSGIEIRWEGVPRVQRERVVRLQMFQDRSQALQAAGRQG